MKAYPTKDGKYVAAVFLPTKKRFRTNFTRDRLPVEATSVDELATATRYCSIESVSRAIRKRKVK